MKAVTNPVDAVGAQDRESVADARRNAPLNVLTLDRIVSLQDYEDFARAFAGIEKALAVWAWLGQTRGVFLTVAGPDGEPVNESTPIYDNLLAAMRRNGDPRVAVRVVTYREAAFRISATILGDPDYEPDKVLAAVRDALRSNFSFDARQFGQPVALSEVISVMQAVEGVIAVDVNTLFRTDSVGGSQPAQLVPASGAQVGARGDLRAAELLTLDVNSLDQVLFTS